MGTTKITPAINYKENRKISQIPFPQFNKSLREMSQYFNSIMYLEKNS